MLSFTTRSILPKRVYSLDCYSRFMTVPVPPRQPSDDATVNSPADSTGRLGACSPRTASPLSIAFSQLLLHPLTWPHTGLWSETIFPEHELDSDSPTLKSPNSCPGFRDKGWGGQDPRGRYPVLPSSGRPCRPEHPSLLLSLPHPRSVPHTWAGPLGSGLAPLDT